MEIIHFNPPIGGETSSRALYEEFLQLQFKIKQMEVENELRKYKKGTIWWLAEKQKSVFAVSSEQLGSEEIKIRM